MAVKQHEVAVEVSITPGLEQGAAMRNAAGPAQGAAAAPKRASEARPRVVAV
jgi:hypothetical protein